MKKSLTTLFFITYFMFPYLAVAQNNSLNFDGGDDYVSLSNSLYTSNLQGHTEITIEYWFKGSQLQSAVRFQDGPYIVAGWSDPPQFIISSDGGTTGLVISEDVEDNKWHHIACVWESNTINGFKTYVDGVLTNQRNSANVTLPDISSGAWIGSFGASGERLNGDLDEIRIWNAARTETQIRQNMYRELPNPTAEVNLIAYYQMNGNLFDASSNNYTGSFNGGTASYLASSAFFGPKNCLDFSGSGEDVYTELNTTSSSVITIEGFVKFSNINGQQNIIHINDGGINTRIVPFKDESNHMCLFVAGSDGLGEVVSSSSALGANVWYHTAFVYNNQQVKIYINGKLEADESISKTFSIDGSDRLYLGSDWGTGSFEFYGFLDEIRVWNTERTALQIRENMFKNLSGNESNLIHYNNFDHSSGTVLQDLSIYSNDGTINDITDDDWVSSTAFNTWLNTSSTSWSTSSNWSRGAVPASGDNVHIEQFTALPSSSSDITLNNMVVAPNSPIDFNLNLTTNGNAFFYSPYTIYSGKGITVEGDFFNDNSKSSLFTVKSGGSLITNGEVAGSIQFEKSISDDQWHLVSAAVAGIQSGTFTGDYLQRWDETTANWLEIPNTDYNLSAGIGYGLYPVAKSNYVFTGTPNSGNIPVAISYTVVPDSARDGANLLGNPYPSSLDWDQVDGFGAVYYWDGSQYLAYPETGGYGTGSQFIPPMQGFFIVVPDNNPSTFTFTNDMRTHSGASNYYKSEKKLENGIMLTALSNAQEDDLLIRCLEDASEEFEIEKDALKLKANITGKSEIWTVTNNNELSIDVRDRINTVQLGYSNSQNGNYSIILKEIGDIGSAELEDTKLNIFHDLTNGAYSFNWNTSDSEERFILHLKATGTEDLEEQDIQVYSANGQLYIRQNQDIQFDQLIIYDLAGRVITEKGIQNQNLQNFDLSHLSGAYLIHLKGTNNSITKKIIMK